MLIETYESLIYRTYAVGRFGGTQSLREFILRLAQWRGLEGRSPSENICLWAARGGIAAASGPQKGISGSEASPNPATA